MKIENEDFIFRFTKARTSIIDKIGRILRAVNKSVVEYCLFNS